VVHNFVYRVYNKGGTQLCIVFIIRVVHNFVYRVYNKGGT
jgi:hypothetical protein